MQTVSILKKGEIKHFQIKMPQDAKAITGIQTEMHIPPLEAGGGGGGEFPPVIIILQPIKVVGEITLQSMNEASVFYTGEVNDESGEKKLTYSPETVGLPEKSWTHGYNRMLHEVMAEATPVIWGIYQDRLGEASDIDIAYTVQVQVWYETNPGTCVGGSICPLKK